MCWRWHWKRTAPVEDRRPARHVPGGAVRGGTGASPSQSGTLTRGEGGATSTDHTAVLESSPERFNLCVGKGLDVLVSNIPNFLIEVLGCFLERPRCGWEANDGRVFGLALFGFRGKSHLPFVEHSFLHSFPRLGPHSRKVGIHAAHPKCVLRAMARVCAHIQESSGTVGWDTTLVICINQTPPLC